MVRAWPRPFCDWEWNRNGNQLEHNACMLAPAPVLIRQSTNCCQGGNILIRITYRVELREISTDGVHRDMWILQAESLNSVVRILDGYSEIGAHVRSNLLFDLLRHLIRSRAVANWIIFL